LFFLSLKYNEFSSGIFCANFFTIKPKKFHLNLLFYLVSRAPFSPLPSPLHSSWLPVRQLSSTPLLRSQCGGGGAAIGGSARGPRAPPPDPTQSYCSVGLLLTAPRGSAREGSVAHGGTWRPALNLLLAAHGNAWRPGLAAHGSAWRRVGTPGIKARQIQTFI
jgi:hypothetical protein